jgi:hypothetical protein
MPAAKPPRLRCAWQASGMDPDMFLELPPTFDDSDDPEGQVHPVARRLFHASSPAEVFEKVRRWLDAHEAHHPRVVDVTWDHFGDETEPYSLSVYLSFDVEPE